MFLPAIGYRGGRPARSGTLLARRTEAVSGVRVGKIGLCALHTPTRHSFGVRQVVWPGDCMSNPAARNRCTNTRIVPVNLLETSRAVFGSDRSQPLFLSAKEDSTHKAKLLHEIKPEVFVEADDSKPSIRSLT